MFIIMISNRIEYDLMQAVGIVEELFQIINCYIMNTEKYSVVWE